MWSMIIFIVPIVAADGKGDSIAVTISPSSISATPMQSPAIPGQPEIYRRLHGELLQLAGQDEPLDNRMVTVQSKRFNASSYKQDGHESEIAPGVWLSILERQKEAMRVRIFGWQQDGVPHLVYALPGKRIVSATLDRAMQRRVRHIGDRSVPDTDQTWRQVSLDGWIGKGGLVSDDGKLWAYASQIHQQTCAMCHPLPATDHLTANGWLGRLKAMKLNTNLREEEYLVLLRYLQLNASDSATGEAFVADDSHSDKITVPAHDGAEGVNIR
jgi:trimethylamine-N-oxide reductase cytochrome c-type subunit TorC